jgi:hypothetical protein
MQNVPLQVIIFRQYQTLCSTDLLFSKYEKVARKINLLPFFFAEKCMEIFYFLQKSTG